MVERFPSGTLPNGHVATHNNRRMIVEGPRDDTYKGVDAKRYLVYAEDGGVKGYVYYHADSQEFLGAEGNPEPMVLDSSNQMVAEANI